MVWGVSWEEETSCVSSEPFWTDLELDLLCVFSSARRKNWQFLRSRAQPAEAADQAVTASYTLIGGRAEVVELFQRGGVAFQVL